jgi:hypothetical protein
MSPPPATTTAADPAFRVTDLRGASRVASAGAATSPTNSSSVLEDPTGRRRRWLRIAGRTVTVALVAWLLLLVLGGLGIVPSAWIPLDGALGPPRVAVLRHPPAVKPPSRAEARPARPAPGRSASGGVAASGAPAAVHLRAGHSQRPGVTGRHRRHATTHRRGSAVAGSTTATAITKHGNGVGNGGINAQLGGKTGGTSATTTTHGKSSSSSSQTGTAPGQSTTPPGNRGSSAGGTVTGATTTPGTGNGKKSTATAAVG